MPSSIQSSSTTESLLLIVNTQILLSAFSPNHVRARACSTAIHEKNKRCTSGTITTQSSSMHHRLALQDWGLGDEDGGEWPLSCPSSSLLRLTFRSSVLPVPGATFPCGLQHGHHSMFFLPYPNDARFLYKHIRL
jgi:hypothetical protein